MAQFYDGFEQFRAPENTSPAYFMQMAKYITRGVLGAGAGRIGLSVALYTLNSAFERKWSWSGDTLTVGFACRQQARGALFSLRVGDTTGRAAPFTMVYTDPITGFVTIRNTDGNSDIGYVTPLPQRWYYYEVTANRSTGVITVHVNGKEDAVFTLDADVKAATEITLVFNPFDSMPVFPAEVEYADDTKQYDDLYIQDGGRKGPIQITGRLPSGDRSRQWLGSDNDPLAAHNRLVGVLPPEPADRFIFTAVNDMYDSYISTAALPDNGEILAQGVIALIRKATSDPVSIIANVDSHAITMSNVGRSWEYRYTLMPADGYDKTTIEAAEFGVRSVI